MIQDPVPDSTFRLFVSFQHCNQTYLLTLFICGSILKLMEKDHTF